jgi:hypothetical protein
MNQNIKEQLKAVADYLEVNRQVGHSKTLSLGLNNSPDALVLVHNLACKKDFPRIEQERLISLASLDRLRGERAPLVIDNAAMWLLMRDAVETIESLEKKLADRP